MKDYIALDIENPNSRGNSLCAVGILVVKNGKTAERIYSLIDPEDSFDRNNSAINGITENMVQGAPTLPVYWEHVGDIIADSPIVGHNIRYDLNVISKALERYDIPVPDFRYVCTLQMSRRLMDEPSYKLASLAEKTGYKYRQHHALEEAEAADHLYRYLVSTYDIGEIVPDVFHYVHL